MDNDPYSVHIAIPRTLFADTIPTRNGRFLHIFRSVHVQPTDNIFSSVSEHILGRWCSSPLSATTVEDPTMVGGTGILETIMLWDRCPTRAHHCQSVHVPTAVAAA